MTTSNPDSVARLKVSKPPVPAPTPRGLSGPTLALDQRSALQALIARVGLEQAARTVGVGRESVARGASGAGLRRGTIALILEGLKRSEGAEPR